MSGIDIRQSAARALSDRQPNWQYDIKHGKKVVHHRHEFATTQVGSKTLRRDRPRQKRKKIKDPARFENSQKGSDLGKRGNIK